MRMMLGLNGAREESIRRLLRGAPGRRWLLDLARAGSARRDRGCLALVRRLNRILARGQHDLSATRDA
jgi:hypothetical protein